MRFIKISLFFFMFFFFFTLKASGIDEESWKLSGAFFLNKKCYISVQEKRGADDGFMRKSLMMVLDCQHFIPQPQGIFPVKEKVKERYWFRYAACYNSFYYRQRMLDQLLKGELYEANLLQDSYLRSIVVSALRKRLKEPENFAVIFLTGKILDLLGGATP